MMGATNMSQSDENLRQVYDRAFFAAQVDGSARSARIIVPILLGLCPNVQSVVDVGCGTGVWLAEFKRAGVKDVLGIDGGSARDQGQLEISNDEFLLTDLERELPVERRFDLCVCLEVGEHLSPASAPGFVQSLCKLSGIVAFSAALPGQTGTRHINERWLSYWVNFFRLYGFRPLDLVRPRVWHDPRVEWWYRQNVVLFADDDGSQRIRAASERASAVQELHPLDVVHPDCFTIFRTELERNRAAVAALRAELAELSAERAAAAAARDTVEALEGRVAALNDAVVAREVRIGALSSENDAILQSTSWKMTYPLRRLVGSGARSRRFSRRVAYFVWWSITGQLVAKLRDRRRQRAA